MDEKKLPQPGQIWHTPFGPCDHRAVTATGDELSDYEFDQMLISGQLRLVEKGSFASGQPDVYEEAPARPDELFRLLEQASTGTTQTETSLGKLIQAGTDPQLGIEALEYEIDRQRTLHATTYARFTDEIARIQSKSRNERTYSQNRKLHHLIDRRAELRTYEAQMTRSQTVVTAATLLQRKLSPDWTEAEMSAYRAGLFEARAVLSRDSHPLVAFIDQRLIEMGEFRSQQQAVVNVVVQNVLHRPRHRQVGGARKRNRTNFLRGLASTAGTVLLEHMILLAIVVFIGFVLLFLNSGCTPLF